MSRPMNTTQRRLALVQLYSEEQAPSSAPYSIEVLGGHVKTEAPGWHASLLVLDPKDGGGPEELSKRLSDERVDVVGLSVPQGTFTLAQCMLKELSMQRETSRWNPLVLLGNSLPTYRPNSFLDRFPEAVVIRGFGEDALLAVLQRMDDAITNGVSVNLEGVPNLVRMDQGRITQTPVVWPRRYAVPTWVDPNRYFARIEASRGCHYDVCTFCTRPPRSYGEARWFRYPVEDVVATVARLKELGVPRFTFCDEDFIGNDMESRFHLAESLKAIGGAPAFSFSTRADNIYKISDSDAKNQARRELFEALREVGLSLVFVGCESFCDSQLKRYGKSSTTEGNLRALRTLQELKIDFESGLILFDPFMNLDELEENIETIDRHELWRVTSQTLSRLDVQEHTPMQRWVEKEGLLGVYDENTMTYDYRFQDPVVGKIVDVSTRWKAETDYAYRLVRNAQRMALFDDFPNDVMVEAKLMNFEFLKKITKAISCGEDMDEVVREMVGYRRTVIAGLLKVVESPRVHVSLSEALRKEISGFLGNRG